MGISHTDVGYISVPADTPESSSVNAIITWFEAENDWAISRSVVSDEGWTGWGAQFRRRQLAISLL